jgi:FMN-dependent NADH-azoreductase
MDIQEDISDEVVHRLIQAYKKKLETDKIRYHNIVKVNPDYMEKNRVRAREHYKKNKDKKKEYYQNNRDVNISRNSYYYYKKINKLEQFKEKKKDHYDCLLGRGLINPID